MKSAYKVGDTLFYIEEIHYKEDDEFRFRIKKGVVESIFIHENGSSYQFHNGSAHGNRIYTRYLEASISLKNLFDVFTLRLWTKISEARV